MYKIGVISDTHDYLDPAVPEFFKTAQVQHILHAGDIGFPWLITELEQIAPVTAVAGNTDAGEHLGYREIQVVNLAGLKFLIRHIVDVHSPAPALERRLLREKPDAVIFGHSHKPYSEHINGRFYFNPGYAGKTRFGLPRSIAILSCQDKTITPEYKFLE